MDSITNLEQLVSLMQEREEVYAEYTAAIAEILQPTVLSALQEVLEARPDQIEWTEIFMSQEDLTLRVICAVTYGKQDKVPAFVAAIAVAEPNSSEGDTRMIRVGIPITYSLRPKEEILTFFKQLISEGHQTPIGYEATETEMVKPQDAHPTAQFDLSDLSKDQVTQLLAFQQYTNGGKH